MRPQLYENLGLNFSHQPVTKGHVAGPSRLFNPFRRPRKNLGSIFHFFLETFLFSLKIRCITTKNLCFFSKPLQRGSVREGKIEFEKKEELC